MPFYKKLTEYCSKKIFNPDFPIIEINHDTPKSTILNFIKIHKDVIIKVDEFVKRRGKNGLVKKTNDVNTIIKFMDDNRKYSHFILEKTFNIIEEKYFCIQYHKNCFQNTFEIIMWKVCCNIDDFFTKYCNQKCSIILIIC